jgi:two-component system C4-dicarboxylate transport sensor histidine kinase DctB
LNTRLAAFADRAGLGAIYLMDVAGQTISASNHAEPTSFVGQNYAFRPYFSNALAGGQGRFYAIGATTGRPGYFIADPVRDAAGDTIGVIAIKIDFSTLEESWRSSGEQVLLANRDGVVLLASDQAWRYRTLTALTDDQRAKIIAARQFTGQDLAMLDWVPTDDQRARIGGAELLHLTSEDLPQGWALHYFTSDDRAVAQSWLVTALVGFAGGLALILFQVQRARRVSAALAISEKEEAQLRQANARLAVEIEDRRRAERRLQRTQNELERASRLAALGQLAASVTHELGQPIAAMRNHLTAAEISAKPTATLAHDVGSLVDRMEAITRQLKFFARSAPEPFVELDLRDAVATALILVQPNFEAAGITCDVQSDPDPIMMRGIRLHLEQVLTNILRNAADAVEGTDDPMVTITLGGSDADVWMACADNGHGLGQATLAELQEPFVTTRESGQGMGLGLAISASIVSDLGGVMTAENRPDGGAIFKISFPSLAALREAAE